MTRKPRCFLRRVKGQLHTRSTGKTARNNRSECETNLSNPPPKKFDVQLDLEYEATTMIRNVGNNLSNDRTSHPRRQASSSPVVCAVCTSHLKQFITGYTTTDCIRHDVWPAA